MDLKIDDLLEKKDQGVDALDMEYVSLSVNKVLALLNKCVGPLFFSYARTPPNMRLIPSCLAKQDFSTKEVEHQGRFPPFSIFLSPYYILPIAIPPLPPPHTFDFLVVAGRSDLRLLMLPFFYNYPWSPFRSPLYPDLSSDTLLSDNLVWQRLLFFLYYH